MLASEMIKQLTELVAKHGDWEVHTSCCDECSSNDIEYIEWNGPIEWSPSYIPNFKLR